MRKLIYACSIFFTISAQIIKVDSFEQTKQLIQKDQMPIASLYVMKEDCLECLEKLLIYEQLSDEFRYQIQPYLINCEKDNLQQQICNQEQYPKIYFFEKVTEKDSLKQYEFQEELTIENLLNEMNKIKDSIKDKLAMIQNETQEEDVQNDQQDKQNKITHILKKVNLVSFQKILNSSNQWILAQFSNKQANILHKVLDIKRRFKYFFTNIYYMVECIPGQCQYEQDSIAIFPSIDNKQEHIIYLDHQVSTSFLIQKMLNVITKQGSSPIEVKKNTVYSQLKEYAIKNYTPILWFYDSKDQFQELYLYAINAKKAYQAHLRILAFKNPNQEIKEQWSIKMLPKIIAFQDNNFQAEQLQIKFQKTPTFENLISYFNELNEKKQKQLREIIQINNQQEYGKWCADTYFKCIIAFINTTSKNSQNYINIIEQVLYIKLDFNESLLNWLWIDSSQHKYLLSQFKISKKDSPFLIVLNPQNNKYIQYDQTFKKQNIQSFLIDSNTLGQTKVYQLKAPIQFHEVKQINKKLEQKNFNSDIIKEIADIMKNDL